jgi:hypothetical protein
MRTQPDMTESFLEILRICQEIGAGLALTRVAALVRERLATLVAFVPVTSGRFACSVTQVHRANLRTTRVAARALDTGFRHRSRRHRAAESVADSVRLSGVGALWCQWGVEMPLLHNDMALMGMRRRPPRPPCGAIERRVPARGRPRVPELIGESAGIQAMRQALCAPRRPRSGADLRESGSGKSWPRAVHLTRLRPSDSAP